jgi:hypothetical protein
MGQGGRVALQVPAAFLTELRFVELRSFVGHCTERIERELGTLERWTVMLVPRIQIGFMGVVIVEHAGRTVEGRSPGRDALFAVWNAMCRVEQPLRDSLRRPWPRR